MSKLNERLTLVANLSVVVGIVFLAVEMQQNTEAVQAQTRDSVTEKQLEFLEVVASNRDLATVSLAGFSLGIDEMEPVDRHIFGSLAQASMRVWENSHYQYQRGLFTADDFLPRTSRWRETMAVTAYRDVWALSRHTFSPSFRAEIDRIVAEVEQAQ